MSIFSAFIPQSLKDKIKRMSGAPDMFWSIQNMKTNGFHPRKIVDIGAYTGEWTLTVNNIFPEAHFLMVEPQDSRKQDLEKICARNNRIKYANTLLAAQANQSVVFHEMETASSVLTEHYEVDAKNTQKITSTLDQIIDLHNFQNADFIKLDTQGYEIEILKGGINALKNAECVLMEVNLLDIHQQCPLLHDVVAFMHDHDLIAYDICSFTRRPLDRALWQTDIIFVKSDSKLRKSKRYS